MAGIRERIISLHRGLETRHGRPPLLRQQQLLLAVPLRRLRGLSHGGSSLRLRLGVLVGKVRVSAAWMLALSKRWSSSWWVQS